MFVLPSLKIKKGKNLLTNYVLIVLKQLDGSNRYNFDIIILFLLKEFVYL